MLEDWSRPREIVIAPNLTEFKKCLENGFRHMVLYLLLSCEGSGVDLGDLCRFLPIRYIPWFYDSMILWTVSEDLQRVDLIGPDSVHEKMIWLGEFQHPIFCNIVKGLLLHLKELWAYIGHIRQGPAIFYNFLSVLQNRDCLISICQDLSRAVHELRCYSMYLENFKLKYWNGI